ncbi:MAG: peptidoglycan recognition family protein [Bacteroidia bacterium]
MAEEEKLKYFHQYFDWEINSLRKEPDKPDWRVFLEKLNLHLDEYKELRKKLPLSLLQDFSIFIMGNIHYYEKKIIREKTYRLAYVLLSLSLLLLVPIVVVLIQRNSVGGSVSGEITAMFTGFFALYQGVSKLVEKRKLISNYWQTKSNLKARLYSLEDKWKYTHDGEGWDHNKVSALVDDLREAVKFGLDAQRVEKQLFFDQYRYPKFNILGSILGTSGQVSQLFQGKVREVEGRAELSADSISPINTLTKLTQTADLPSEVKGSKPDAPLDTPRIVSRADWNASPPKDLNNIVPLGEIKSIVLHHAAGFWDGMRSGSEQVRAIQNLHQNKNNWEDIGYHFIVDPLGIIYQGRSYLETNNSLDMLPRLIRGAHIGGFNTGRIGICLLGNYQPNTLNYSGMPSPEGLDSLIQLIRFLQKNYHPKGDTHASVQFKQITAHRDFKNTSCPGDILYAHMNKIRKAVLTV